MILGILLVVFGVLLIALGFMLFGASIPIYYIIGSLALGLILLIIGVVFLIKNSKGKQPKKKGSSVVYGNTIKELLDNTDTSIDHDVFYSQKEFNKIKASAEAGDPIAQYKLGMCYFDANNVNNNDKEALKWLTLSMNQGNVDAMNLVGLFYFEGIGVEKDEKKALELFKKCVDKNNVDAMRNLGVLLIYSKNEKIKNQEEGYSYLKKAYDAKFDYAYIDLGDLYRRGIYVKKDKAKGFKFYMEASKLYGQFVYLAYWELAGCYYHGIGVEKNLIEGIRYTLKSAKKDYSLAQVSIADFYSSNKDEYVAARDYKKALDWSKHAARHNNAKAHIIVGQLYANIYGNEKAMETSLKWYLKAYQLGDIGALSFIGQAYYILEKYDLAIKYFNLACDNNIAEAYARLGNCYQEGKGVKRDIKKAVQLYKKSVELGSSLGMGLLAFCYKQGDGVTINYKKAFELFFDASKEHDAIAYKQLGHFYYDSLYVKKDLTKAFEYFYKAAIRGNSYAQHNVGTCYLYGEGVTRNYKEALKWYKKAEEQNLVEAITSIGAMYQEGQGVEKSYRIAIEYFEKALSINPNDTYALTKIGYLYSEGGYGINKNLRKAVSYYKKAADLGYDIAMFNLATCYELGEGVPKSLEEAIKWYKKAALTLEEARESLRSLGVRYY